MPGSGSFHQVASIGYVYVRSILDLNKSCPKLVSSSWIKVEKWKLKIVVFSCGFCGLVAKDNNNVSL